jgi:hypothetical protein
MIFTIVVIMSTTAVKRGFESKKKDIPGKPCGVFIVINKPERTAFLSDPALPTYKS